MNQGAVDSANTFIAKLETAYNTKGAAEAAQLYTPDSVLVGFTIADGRTAIAKLLGAIIGQGWTQIHIRVVNARAVEGTVLVACEYTATGSGPNAGKTVSSRSSYVLTRHGDEWLAAMHTAA